MQQLLDFDRQYTQRLRIAEKPGWLRSAAVLLAHSGDSWFWLLGLLLVWWFAPGEWSGLALVMIASILILAVIVMGIKFTVRRQRPEGEWGGIYRKTDPHSFPSGHAARAALLAVLALGLGPVWFGALLLVWAPLVMLARVAMGVHYLSDIVAGALLGVFDGIIALLIHAAL